MRGRSADGYYQRALALHGLGRWKAAKEAAELALYASPHHGQARLVLADALLRLGRATRAVDEYGEILRRHPYLLNEEQRKQCNDLLKA